MILQMMWTISTFMYVDTVSVTLTANSNSYLYIKSDVIQTLAYITNKNAVYLHQFCQMSLLQTNH